MQVVLYGMNHRTAPVGVRERLAAGEDTLWTAVQDLLQTPGLHPVEAVVLSTCNRFEVYFVAPSLQVADASFNTLVHRLAGLSLQSLQDHLYRLEGQDAVWHLFRVAAGLDSMILGEPQILGQVREAWEAARKLGVVGPILHRLFQQAVTAGKRVRRETDIGKAPASVGSAAAHLVKEHLSADANRAPKALVVGAGTMARTAARYLRDLGFHHLAVMNRTARRAEALARELNARTFPWQAWHPALAWADVVITAVAAPEPILGPEDVGAIMEAGRPPLLLVDIGVPRNIDPRVADLPGVRLFDIDDLRGVVDAGLALRRAAVPQAEAILREEMDAFLQWWQMRKVTPLLHALHQRAEAVRQDVLQRTLKRMHVNGETQEVVDQVTRILLEKWLQIPARNLRVLAQQGHPEEAIRLLAQVFELIDPPRNG